MQISVLNWFHRLPRRARGTAVGAVALLAVALGVTGFHSVFSGSPAVSTAFPQNAAMEQQLGVRFSRVAVVGDGGLVYLATDPLLDPIRNEPRFRQLLKQLRFD